MADELGITEMLFLGKGIGTHTLPHSLAAAVLESLIGAIYIDGGIEVARDFITRHMTAKIDAVIANQHSLNYKSILQQYAQRHWSTTPAYETLDEQGPDHAKAFEVSVVVDGRRFATPGATVKSRPSRWPLGRRWRNSASCASRRKRRWTRGGTRKRTAGSRSRPGTPWPVDDPSAQPAGIRRV